MLLRSAQKNPETLLMNTAMTATHNFLARILYNAIKTRLESLKVTVSQDGRVEGLEGTAAADFFKLPVEADEATVAGPLKGIKDYICKNEKLKGIVRIAPRKTEYAGMSHPPYTTLCPTKYTSSVGKMSYNNLCA